jgi:hypothetical protein
VRVVGDGTLRTGALRDDNLLVENGEQKQSSTLLCSQIQADRCSHSIRTVLSLALSPCNAQQIVTMVCSSNSSNNIISINDARTSTTLPYATRRNTYPVFHENSLYALIARGAQLQDANNHGLQLDSDHFASTLSVGDRAY